MATSIQQAFRDFKSNLEITDYQTGLVSQRRNNVISAISRVLTLHPNTPSLLIGSHDRHTLTRYLSEGDVDVMVVLHYGENKVWDTSQGTIQVLEKFKAILDATYPATENRRDRNCITMKFTEFRLDVVPAFINDLGYFKIPDSIRQEWVSTHPIRFAESISTVNGRMENSFIPLIKMVKGWNRHVGWPLRSFHLECLLYNQCCSYTQGYTYSSMLKSFFDNLPGYLSSACTDPIAGDRVDTYLDNLAVETRRQIALRWARKAADTASKAFGYEESYPELSIKTWKLLLGEFFPSYG